MDKKEIIKILKEYKNTAGEKYGIIRIGLFGSFATGETHEESDIDIIVDLIKPDLFILTHIKEELEEIFGKRVDVVRNRKKMNPFLKKRIGEKAIYV